MVNKIFLKHFKIGFSLANYVYCTNNKNIFLKESECVKKFENVHKINKIPIIQNKSYFCKWVDRLDVSLLPAYQTLQQNVILFLYRIIGRLRYRNVKNIHYTFDTLHLDTS